MQKEIKAADYLREVGMSLSQTFQNHIPLNVVEVNAIIFFNVFGVEVVEPLVKANNDEPGYPAKVYQCLYTLYKHMGNEQAEHFMNVLKQGYEARKTALS